MFMRRVVVGSLAVVALAVAGCTDDPPAASGSLPDAQSLLRDAAASTRDIKSAHFTLQVNGQIKELPVHRAEGDLTREGGPTGAAKGTISMDLFGQLFEGEFVLVDDAAYIKAATGGFQKLPASLVSGLYDPSAILDPDRGIAKVLSSVRDAKTEAMESAEGASTYKVSGRVSQDVAKPIVPGVESDVDVTFWLREDNKRPVKASVKMPGGTVDVTLSDVDKPVTITAPV
jgi:lipoprotein LprG